MIQIKNAVGFLWQKQTIKPVSLQKHTKIIKFIDGNGKHKAVKSMGYFYRENQDDLPGGVRLSDYFKAGVK